MADNLKSLGSKNIKNNCSVTRKRNGEETHEGRGSRKETREKQAGSDKWSEDEEQGLGQGGVGKMWTSALPRPAHCHPVSPPGSCSSCRCQESTRGRMEPRPGAHLDRQHPIFSRGYLNTTTLPLTFWVCHLRASKGEQVSADINYSWSKAG